MNKAEKRKLSDNEKMAQELFARRIGFLPLVLERNGNFSTCTGNVLRNIAEVATSIMNSITPLAIHSSLLGDAKAALHVRGLPSDVRFKTGASASASTSGVSPVVTVASVKVMREWEGGARYTRSWR